MQIQSEFKHVLVTGGAGYVGAVLVPKLIRAGYKVTVFDLYLYGSDVLKEIKGNSQLREIKGDIRDCKSLDAALEGVDAIIHLACISNDPSFELNPDLGKSINFDAFESLVSLAKKNRVQRFIYASSSSVYGIKEEEQVTEDLPLEPLTDYSKFKAMCEDVLLKHATDDFTCFTVRPATVCGYSPRLRLDLTVNILTNHAINNGVIKVFGGKQERPNIHIQDMAEFYLHALTWPHHKIHKKIYNVGHHNYSLDAIAGIVKSVIGEDISIHHAATDDNRSYRVSSAKLQNDLGFAAKYSVEDAVRDLKRAFENGLIPDSMQDPRYFNIELMRKVQLA
jgi:nucleoside-diphosphate-sugar epimerase